MASRHFSLVLLLGAALFTSPVAGEQAGSRAAGGGMGSNNNAHAWGPMATQREASHSRACCHSPPIVACMRSLPHTARRSVRPATPGGSAKIKFKEEILPLKESLGGMRSIFSHNCVLAMPRERLNMAVRDLTSAFPAIQRVEANATLIMRVLS